MRQIHYDFGKHLFFGDTFVRQSGVQIRNAPAGGAGIAKKKGTVPYKKGDSPLFLGDASILTKRFDIFAELIVNISLQQIRKKG